MAKFQESINQVKYNYKELAKAVGGFTKEQSNQILNICVKNTLLNCGSTNHDIELMKMFSFRGDKNA